MKHKFTKITLLTAVVAGFTAACNPASENIPTGKRYEFNNILDIAYTPDTLTRCRGCSQTPVPGWDLPFRRKITG